MEWFEREQDLTIIKYDENLTTLQARKELVERGETDNDLKRKVDSHAARLILEDYLS